MKATIAVLLFLLISCSGNLVAPVEHSFFSGDINGDFNILVKTTNYYDIGDGAEIGVIADLKTILTIKDKRLRSVREANPINAINYRKKDSLLPVAGKQAVLFFAEGKTDMAVEIITENSRRTIKASFFGLDVPIPEPLVVGNFMRGVLCSDISIQEELALLERYIELDSADWVASTVKRLATGLYFVDRHGVKGVSENGIPQRMFQFINSNMEKSKYEGVLYWACLAIMYSGVVNPDSIGAFYLRFIIESPHLKYLEDNRRSLDLLKKRDYGEFLDLVRDIISNPSAYADKSAMDSVSLADIAKEKNDSLSQ
jgi:hypothetical protein